MRLESVTAQMRFYLKTKKYLPSEIVLGLLTMQKMGRLTPNEVSQALPIIFPDKKERYVAITEAMSLFDSNILDEVAKEVEEHEKDR